MNQHNTITLLFIFIFIFMLTSGCISQTPSTVTLTPGVSPIATFTETSAPTKAPTATDTITPSATESPLIEISSQSSLNPLAEFPEITEIHMTNETSGWAFASIEDNVLVLHTSDGGTSWRDVTPPFEIWSAYIGTDEGFLPQLGESSFLDDSRAWISTVRFDKTRPQDAYTNKIMLSTEDGGATWRLHKFPPEGVGYGHFVDFVDPLHGWFVMHEIATSSTSYTGLYRTVDGGKSWDTVLNSFGTSSGKLRAIAFGDTLTGVMTDSFFGWDIPLYVRWTHDGGTTWETQDIPEPEDPSINDPSISDFECGSIFPHAFSKLEVAFLAECRMLKDAGTTENIYVFSHYLYSTEDGGLSWQAYPAPSGHLHLLTPNYGWMLGQEIHLTEDGGKSWTKINEVTWQGQFNFIDAFHGWAVARNDDEIALVKTENGGRSWMIVVPKLEQ